MSQFAPVHLPEDRQLNDRVSQTMLRHFNGCPRAGYLYALTRGQVRTMEMMRGSAGHAIFERSTRAALENGEVTIPSEVVKVIVDEVLADPEFAVPFEEHDYLREMSFRWAGETVIDPAAVVAVETLFTLDVGGFAVRCKIDYAEVVDEGARVIVRDYKTGRGAPSFEEIARKLPDGRLMARNFQLCLYALALAFGVPVRVEECPCEGKGQMQRLVAATREKCKEWVTCPYCEGRGRIEIPEPFPVAGRANLFQLEFVYPGIEDREGKMVRRPVTLTRPELDQYRASLEGLVARVRHSEETGDWPAVVSDAACSECPAAGLCPIPAELRDHRGTVNTVEECAPFAEALHRDKADVRARGGVLRKFLNKNGPVRFGNDMLAEVVYSEHEEIFDKEGLLEATERARRFGDPFERAQYIRTKSKNDTKLRALTAEELAEEVDDGNEGIGGVESGAGRGTADERWGTDAPY